MGNPEDDATALSPSPLAAIATLADHLPAGAHTNAIEIEIAETTTVGQLIDHFAQPVKLVHLVLLNGAYVPPDKRAALRLCDGDQLAIWPPTAGG